MKSQRLADTDDGGGRMTGIEVVDGNVNNLFPDISRTDRVYGRVSLRKAFMGVFTDDDSIYYGAHVILTDPADDPLVHTCLFTTNDPVDFRVQAQDRIESYITQGPLFRGWLWNTQPEGSRTLSLFCSAEVGLPQVGDVWYLVENQGEGDEYSQYVRITDVDQETRSFFANGMNFSRRTLTLGIGDPLQHSFHGTAINKNDNLSPAAKVYEGQVADAAQYYGVMRLSSPISSGALVLPVDSIFTYLVPSAQSEAPVVDVQAGTDVAPVLDSGVTYSFTYYFRVMAGVTLFLGFGIKTGSLSVSGYYSWTDDGGGNLVRGDDIEGTVDYGTGEVTWADDLTVNRYQTWSISAEAATAIPRVSNTHATEVEINNRGYNWTASLRPIPAPGTLVADYMSQGKWYRLKDNGAGELVGEESGLGTGSIDYGTGAVIVTTGALPDVGSLIMYGWGTPTEYTERAGDLNIEIPGIEHTLPDSVAPGTLTITWEAGGATRTTTDDSNGNLTGDGTGRVVYQSGQVYLRPGQVVDPGSQIHYAYDFFTQNQETVPFNESGDHTLDFTLPNGPIRPGTVEFRVEVSLVGTKILTVTDDGSGNLVSDTIRAHSHRHRYEATLTSGSTINYTTGEVHLVGALSGTYFYRPEIYQMVETMVSGPGAVFGNPGGRTGPRKIHIGWGAEVSEAVNLYFRNGQNLACNYSRASIFGQPITDDLDSPPLVINLLPLTSESVVAGSLMFNWAGHTYVDRAGTIYRDVDHETNSGIIAGTIDYGSGLATLSSYVTGTNDLTISSLLSEFRPQALHDCQFRTPGAPLRPGSFYVQLNTEDGELLNATADFNGNITGDRITGTVDTETGVVILSFGELLAAEGNELEPWYDATLVEGGNIWVPTLVNASTIRYNCVVYSHLPLDAGLIGLNPVRLPQDGRVPIVKSGYIVVIHHTLQETMPEPLSAAQVVNLPRGDLSLVELYDADGVFVPTTNYAVDLATGVITMADPLDLAGFTEPLTALHRREDMALVSDVQINGQISLTAAVTHDYPAGETYVSSALLFGDLAARVYGLFDQQTWTSVWSDTLIGNACTANYNEVAFPLVITNSGAIEERWALVFDSPTHFDIVGESVGVIGEGYINNACTPINPATGSPYFSIQADGWGAGWATNNVVRFNTTAANAPIWIARTTLSGPVTEPNDQFVIQIRGDAD